MTFIQAKSLVKTLYYSVSARSDIDEAQLGQLINVSNAALWLEAIGLGGSVFAVDSPDQSIASGVFDTSALNPHEILSVEWKATTGEYIRLDYSVLQDRERFNLGTGLTALDPCAYTMVGTNIYLLPRTTGTVTARISYIPKLADMTADADNLLNNKLTMFHSLVAYDATITLLTPAAAQSLIKIYSRLYESMVRHLQSRQRSARVVRDVFNE